MRAIARGAAAALLSVAWIPLIHALDWSDSELYLQHGRIDVPSFANLDLTAYMDDSEGVVSGGAPQESSSFMVDFSFARPFKLGERSLSVAGHIEYIGWEKEPGWRRCTGLVACTSAISVEY